MITIKKYVEGLFMEVPDSQEKESIIQEIVLNLEEKVLLEQDKVILVWSDIYGLYFYYK